MSKKFTNPQQLSLPFSGTPVSDILNKSVQQRQYENVLAARARNVERDGDIPLMEAYTIPEQPSLLDRVNDARIAIQDGGQQLGSAALNLGLGGADTVYGIITGDSHRVSYNTARAVDGATGAAAGAFNWALGTELEGTNLAGGMIERGQKPEESVFTGMGEMVRINANERSERLREQESEYLKEQRRQYQEDAARLKTGGMSDMGVAVQLATKYPDVTISGIFSSAPSVVSGGVLMRALGSAPKALKAQAALDGQSSYNEVLTAAMEANPHLDFNDLSNPTVREYRQRAVNAGYSTLVSVLGTGAVANKIGAGDLSVANLNKSTRASVNASDNMANVSVTGKVAENASKWDRAVQGARAIATSRPAKSLAGLGLDMLEEGSITAFNTMNTNLVTGEDAMNDVWFNVGESAVTTAGLNAGVATAPYAVKGTALGVTGTALATGLVANGLVKSAEAVGSLVSKGAKAYEKAQEAKKVTLEDRMDMNSPHYAPEATFLELQDNFLKETDEAKKAEYAKKMYTVFEDAFNYDKYLETEQNKAIAANDKHRYEELEQERQAFGQMHYNALLNRAKMLNDEEGTWQSIKDYASRTITPTQTDVQATQAKATQTEENASLFDRLIASRFNSPFNWLGRSNDISSQDGKSLESNSGNSANQQTNQPNTQAVLRMGKYQFQGGKQLNADDVGRGSGDHLDIHLTGSLKGKNPTEYLDRFIVADGQYQGTDLGALIRSGAYTPSKGQVFGANRQANGKRYAHTGIDFDSRIGGGVMINPKYQIAKVTRHHNPNGYGHYVQVHFTDGVSIGLGHMGKANVDAFMSAYGGENTAVTTNTISGSTPSTTTTGYRFNPSLNVRGLTSDKAEAIRQSAERLGVNPNDLAALISFETAGTFNPAQRNLAGGSATGLIQFMPATARELGTTTEALAKMSFAEQMSYVEKYFKSRGAKGGESLGDLYDMVTGVQTKEYRAGSKEYAANKIWDVDNNGVITKGEAVTGSKFKQHIRDYFIGGETTAPVSAGVSAENTPLSTLEPTIRLEDAKQTQSEDTIEESQTTENITQSGKQTNADASAEETPKIQRRYSKFFETDETQTEQALQKEEAQGTLTKEEADFIRRLSKVKQQIQANSSEGVTKQIFEGFKGTSVQGSNLGLMDYFKVFTNALDGRYNKSTLQKHHDYIEDFNAYSNQKLSAFKEAYANLQKGIPSSVLVTKAGEFQVVEGVLSRDKGQQVWTFNYDEAGSNSTNKANRFMQMVTEQVTAVNTFSDAWREPIQNILASDNGKTNTPYDVNAYLPKELEVSKTSLVKEKTAKPIKEAKTNTTPTNVKEDVSTLGTARKAGKLVSMSNLTNPNNPISIGEAGWLGNPYTVGTSNSFGAKDIQEAMDKFVNLLKAQSKKLEGFTEGLIAEKGKDKLRVESNETNRTTSDFLEKILNELPEDVEQAKAYLDNLKTFDVETGEVIYDKEKENLDVAKSNNDKAKKVVKKVAEAITEDDLSDIDADVAMLKSKNEKSNNDLEDDDLADLEADVEAINAKANEASLKDVSDVEEDFSDIDNDAQAYKDRAEKEEIDENTKAKQEIEQTAKDVPEKLSPKRVVMAALQQGEEVSKDTLKYVNKKALVLGQKVQKPKPNKSIQERNLFVEYFRVTGKANLANLSDMSEQLKEHGFSMLEALGLEKPTDKQKEQLNYFLGFKEMMTDFLVESFHRANEGYYYKDLKQYLVEEDAEGNLIIDDNLLTALSLAIYDYAIMNGNSAYQSNKDILRILSIDDTPESSMLANTFLEPFRNVVSSQQLAALDMGKQITRMLGLTTVKEADVKELARLQASLGNWAVAAMLNSEMFTQEQIPASAIINIQNELNTLKGEKTTLTYTADEVKSFPYLKANIRFEEDKPILNSDLVSEAILSNKETGQFLANVFGFDSHKKLPTLNVVDKSNQKTHTDKLNVALSDTQKDKINTANQASFKFNTGFMNVLKAFKNPNTSDDSAYDELLDIMGAKVSEETLASTHKYFHDGLKGAAEGKKKELLNALEFMASLPEETTEFYDTADVKSNMRQHYRSNVVNPQSNKQQRAMVDLTGYEVTFSKEEMTDFMNGIILDNKGIPTPLANWFRAVFTGLEGFESFFEQRLPMYADGWTEDKIPAEDFIPAAMELINHEKVQKAIKETQKIIEGDFKQADTQIIKAFVQKGEGGLESFRGLYELAQFFDAYNNDKEFSTSLGYSSDGWNNGVAIASSQQGIKDKSLWQRIGLFSEDMQEQSYAEVRRNKSIGDFYTALGHTLKDVTKSTKEAWKASLNKNGVRLKQLNAFMPNEESDSSIKSISSYLFNRKNLKNILIPFNYGAREASIIRSSFNAYVENIYKTLPKLSAVQIKELEATLEVASGRKIKIDNPLSFEFNNAEYKSLQEAFTASVGEVIKDSLREYAEELIIRRDANQNTVSAATSLAIKALNQIIAAKKLVNVQKNFKLYESEGKEAASALNLANYHSLSVKEQEALKEDYPLLFTQLATVFNTDGTGEGLPLISERLTPTKEPETMTEQYVMLNGKKVKTPSVITIPEYEDRGLAPTSAQTQSVDSYISTFANVYKGVVGLNIHDANIANVRHFVEMVKAQNMTFFEAIRDYHYFGSSLKTLQDSLRAYDEYGLDKSILKDELAKFTGIKPKDLTKMTKKEIQKTIKAKLHTLKSYDLEKLSNLEELSYIQQYLGEGGRISITPEMKKSIKEARKEVEKLYKEELADLEALLVSAYDKPTKKVLQARADMLLEVFDVKRAVKVRMDKISFISIQNAYATLANRRGISTSHQDMDNLELLTEVLKETILQNPEFKVFTPLNKNEIKKLDLSIKDENILLALESLKTSFHSVKTEDIYNVFSSGEGAIEADSQSQLTEDKLTGDKGLEEIKKAVKARQISDKQKALFEGLVSVVERKYPKLGLSFTDLEQGSKGYYEKGNIVLDKTFWRNATQEVQVALINHELMHAVTLEAILKFPEYKAVKDLQAMRDQLEVKWQAIKGQDSELDGYLARVFEVKDASELVSYGTENPLVADFIANHLDTKALGLKASKGKYKGALQAFSEAIFALIQKVLGKDKHIPYRVFLENIEAVMSLDVENTTNHKANSKELLITPKEQAIKTLQGMPVASINQKDIDVPKTGFKGIIAWAMGFFDDWRNKAVNPILGEVTLNEQSIRDSLGHGVSFYKVLAIPTLKEVIEQGAVIYHDQTKSNEDSFFVSAPVLLDGKENIVTVTIHRDVNAQRMYVHSVSLTERIKNTPSTTQVSAAPVSTGKPHSLQSSQESDLPNDNRTGKYGKSGRVSKNHEGNITPNQVNRILQNLLNDNSSRRYSKETVEELAIKEANNTDIHTLIKGLDHANVSDEFNAHLDDLNDRLLKTFYKETKRGQADIKRGGLKSLKPHGFMQSQKEAYMHNAVYSVLELALKDQAGSLAVNGLNKLFEDMLAAYPNAKAFFKDFDTVDKETQKRYTKMYNYAFKHKKGNPTARLAALSLTNESFKQVLESHQTKAKKADKTWFDKVMKFFSDVMDMLLGKVMKASSKDDMSKLNAYVTALTQLESQARNEEADKLQTYYETSFNLLNPVNAMVTATARTGVRKLATMNVPILSPVSKSLYNLANSNAQGFMHLFEQMDNANANELQKFSHELVGEVMHQGVKGQLIDKMMRITQHLGKVRQSVKDGTIRALMSEFNTELSKEEQVSITKAVLKTDLSSLVSHGLSVKEAVKLLDNQTRKSKIISLQNELKEKVKEPANAQGMIYQAQALGKYIATEVTTAHMDKNAHAIARSFGTQYETDKANPEVEKVVDMLATLYALERTDMADIQRVKALFEKENKGMTTLLNMHTSLVKKSKEEFNGNPLNFQKGYIVEITNPHTEVVAVHAEEIGKYKARGFELLNPLEQDKLDGSQKRYLMVHTNHNSAKYVSGAMDMIDSHNKGSIIYEAGVNDDEIAQIAKTKYKERAARDATPNYDIDVDEHAMVVTYATDGSIQNYKYEMVGKTRDELLERNLNSFELMGSLSAKLVFRPLMRKQQRDVAKVLIEDAKDYKKNPKAYVFLDFNSHDPKMVSMIRLLPYEAHKVLINEYGINEPIPVRASLFTSLFGYKVFSIINAFDKMDNDLKLNFAEKILVEMATHFLGNKARGMLLMLEQSAQSLMAEIKDMIVVRSGGVLLGNILSNVQLLMVSGINPIKVLKDTSYAWRNGRLYSKDHARLMQVNALIDSTKNKNELFKLNQEKARLTKRLEANPMHPYMEAGLQSTIVEDLSLDTSEGYKTKLEKSIDEWTAKVPKPVKDFFEQITVAKGTQLHNLLSEATQFSDFAAKYSLAKHTYEKALKTNPNISKKAAFEKGIYAAQENFINYDMPTHYALDYANRMGLMVFTKFFLRFQKALVKLLKEQPVQTVGMHILAENLGTQGTVEPFMPNRFGNPFDGSVLMGTDAFGGIITVDMVM